MLDRDIAQYATDRLLEALEREGTGWRQPWCGSGSQISFRTRLPYRGGNQFLLGLQAKPDPRWGTYRSLAAAGLQVAKGEKATPIFFYKPHVVKDRETDEDKQIMLVKSYNVFNFSQLIDPPKLDIPERPEIEIDADAERLIEATGADIRYGGDKAYYSPSGDYIGMPTRNQFESREAFYSTMFHEQTHRTGHPSRLDRNLQTRFGSEAYAVEEILAECSTALICVQLGIVPAPRKESAQYINNWKAVLKADKRNIMTIFGQAQKAADFILATLPEMEPQRPEPESPNAPQSPALG